MLKVNRLQFLLFLFLVCSLNIKAQDLVLDWVNQFGGTSNDTGYDMERDHNGNIIVVGGFKGTVDFDPSSSVFNMTSSGDYDIYIVKFNPLGELLWAKQEGGFGFDRAHDIEIANNGDILVTGYFKNTVDFDPGAGSYSLTSSGDWDSFIQRLDQNGNFIWAKGCHGNGYDRINSMDIDNSGNIILVGSYTGTTDFDPGIGQFLMSSGNLGSTIGYNSFVLKLNSSGDFIWARNLGSTSQNDLGNGVVVDGNGNVYFSGFFKGTVDFDTGISVFNLSTIQSGRAEIYVSKLDSSGSFIWAKNFPALSGPNQGNLGWEMEIDQFGNIATVGYFSGTVDFDPGFGVYSLTANGGNDGFISKLNTNGDFISAYQLGGIGEDRIYDIDFDNNGNQYLVGYFGAGSPVDFDGSSSGVYTLSALGDRDMFILKIDSVDNFLWAYQLGGDLTSPYFSDIGMSITYDNQSIYFTGSFNNTTDFDPTSGTYNLTSNGLADGCVVKLDEQGCIVGVSSIVEHSCDSIYESPSGQFYSSSGIYVDTILNSMGCDSIITIDLTINEIVNTTITDNGSSLSIVGNPVGTTLEWLNCENWSIVQAASTNEYFTQPINGTTYAAIINYNGCIDTSECYTYDRIGLEENINDFIILYPNPITGQYINIKNEKLLDMKVVLRNNLGVILKTENIKLFESEIEIPFGSGIYYLDFIIDNTRFTKRIIKVN